METKDKMIIYRHGFWDKIKQKIRSIFLKKQDIYQEQMDIKEKSNSKEEIMNIYNKVKYGNVNLSDLDKNILYKIMILLNEEIEITSKKMKGKITEANMLLYNIKMHNKELDYKKQNS